MTTGLHEINLRRGVSLGILSGMIWGMVVLLISSTTGVFEFDFGLPANIPIFLAGGGGCGLVLGVFMEVMKDILPLRTITARAVSLSVGIWVVLFSGGVLLHLVNPDRYHLELYQNLQGFALSFVLGLVFAVVWKGWAEKR